MFDSCGNKSYSVDENNVPVFTNITTVQDPAHPGQCLTPSAVRDCTDYGGMINVDCGTAGRPPCACGQTQIGSNCYQPAGTVENNATYLKRGFKNARAQKVWHGRYGWMSHEQGSCYDHVDLWRELEPIMWESYQGNTPPDPNHYLALNLQASYQLTQPNATLGDASGTRSFQIDRLTGNITAASNDTIRTSLLTANENDLHYYLADLFSKHLEPGTGPIFLIGLFGAAVTKNIFQWDITQGERGALSGGGSQWTLTRYTERFDGKQTNPKVRSLAVQATIDLIAGTFELTEWGYGNSHIVRESEYTWWVEWQWAVTKHETCSFTNTTWSHFSEVTAFEDGLENYFRTTTNVISTLSFPYTADQLSQDVVDLLALWDLNDDSVMPWRMDTNLSSAPLVRRNEHGYTDFSGVSTELDWQPASGSQLDGAVIGGPTPAGYAPYWAWNHTQLEQDGANWLRKYGQYAPDWCKHCTEWTNERQGEQGYYGAWMRGNRMLLEMQKWAEILLLTKPAHNFARPCGEDKTAIDQRSINCNTNPAGNLRWPNAPCYCDEPSKTNCAQPVDPNAHYAWNDITKKGTFLSRAFSYNYRDVNEAYRINALHNQRLSHNASALPEERLPDIPAMSVPRSGRTITNIGVAQLSAGPNRCPPLTVVCSPNGEQGNVVVPFPEAAPDGLYQSFAWTGIRQWMTDPLWQYPSVPCDQQDEIFYFEDNTGSCGRDPGLYADPSVQQLASMGYTIEFYTRPYEEALAAVPTGAPALPSGLRLGCVNIGTTNAPNWVGPDCDGPTAQGIAPWAYQARQEQYGCADTAIIDGVL